MDLFSKLLMNQFWIYVALTALCIQISASVPMNDQCEIDPSHKSITIDNLKKHCDFNQLKNIFSNLTSGDFPSTGRYKGHMLACFHGPCGFLEQVWSGKNIFYKNGKPPHDQGLVTNNFFDNVTWLRSKIFRTNAPIDGKDVFEIEYRGNAFTYFIVDYIRKIQKDLYMGLATLRNIERHPIVFFMLEKDK